MEGETYTMGPPPIFYGKEYELCATRMISHLESLDLWEAVEENYDVPELPTNSTMAQMKNHKEKKTKKAKTRIFLFLLSKIIFTRIMNFKSAKEI